ncbi:MAG: triphosphoribosyl-dephospho-CoA synthase [Sulfurifustis sp.]
MIALSPERVARGLRAACIAELRVLKPGNVSTASPGHDMTARDFIVSARAAAPAITAPASGVGERILRGIEATRRVAGCNTNLGIVLLAAPLAHAVLVPRREAPLQRRLHAVLAHLDRRDAELAYRAIRLASPGGLGTSRVHDVRAAPTVTLREAMQTAESWDRIAFQYTHVFVDIFEFALPQLQRAVARHGGRPAALLGLYLALLARFPDSHVARQHGIKVAEEVSERAARLATALSAEGMTERVVAQMQSFDAELKRGGVNPGTTADLTVAALFARRLERELGAATSSAAQSNRVPGAANPYVLRANRYSGSKRRLALRGEVL